MGRIWKNLDLMNKPIVWGALYILCIPIFAYLYSNIREQFYYSHTLLEPSYLEDEVSLIRNMANLLEDQCDLASILIDDPDIQVMPAFNACDANLSSLNVLEGKVIFPASLYISLNDELPEMNIFGRHYDFSEESWAESFSVNHVLEIQVLENPKRQLASDYQGNDVATYEEYMFGGYRGAWGYRDDSVDTYALNVIIEAAIDVGEIGDEQWVRMASISLISRQQTDLNQKILVKLFGLSERYNSQGAHRFVSLELSSEARDLINRIFDAHSGSSSEISGRFSRMIYFSAVTITTLGYGDIVPLTPFARLLVAIQSVLGIVLIGLYLSSIAGKITRSGK